MDSMTIGIIGGAGAVISGLSGVISLVKEYLKTAAAERALKSTVRQRVIGVRDAVSGEIERLLKSDPRYDAELVNELTKLVQDMSISESDKKALLSGLQQRSTVGQRRYAEKLLTEVNDSAKAPVSR